MNELWRRDVLVWIGAALAVGMNAAVGVYNVGHMRANERVLAEARATQAEMAGVVSDMADAETSHRGYVLTGQDEFLDPFRAAELRIRDRVTGLRDRLADDPDQLARLDGVERLAAAKYAEMWRVLDTLAVAGQQAAADTIAAGEGKRIMDALRRVGGEMVRAEERRLAARDDAAKAEYITAEVTTLTGGVLAVVIIAFAAVFGRRELRRRERLDRGLAAARAETERSLAQLDALVRNAPYMIAFYDDRLRFLRVNEALAAGTGLAVADHFGKRLADVQPDISSETIDSFREVMAGGPPITARTVAARGGVFEVSAFQVPVDDDRMGLAVIAQDVTERHAAAERLRKSEERLREMAEAMPQIVWVARGDGSRESYNARWYQYTGLSEADTLGHGKWVEALHPDDRQRGLDAWARAVATGEQYEIEYRFRRHDGQYEWFLGRAVAVRDEGGEIVRWYGTCTGIDEQVRTAQELHEARRFSESVLHSLPSHLAVIEADGRILAVNESWRQFGEANGMPAGYDWTAANYFEACRREDHGQRAEAGIRAVAAGERGAFEMEYPCHGAGRERWFVLRANRFRGDGAVRVVVTHENVTDRVVAEQRVREQTSELRQLTEGLPVLMWACRPTGECDYLSLQWAEYTGKPAEDQLGYAWLDALHPDDRPATEAAWHAAVARGGGYDVEFRIRRHDGAYRWFAVRGFPVRDHTGRVVRWYGSCTDIDDRVRQELILEELVEDRTAALKRSNEDLEKFAYIASHDLQEPLRKIQAFGTRLSDRFRASVGDQGKDYIDRMLDSAGRMRRLIEDLLAFSRVNTKGAPFAPTDLNRLVREVLDDLEDQLARTAGEVRTDDLPTVLGDTSQLRQVFQNLIGNALKFARPGVPPVVRVTAVPFDQLPADPPPPAARGWRLTVSDNGIGFESKYTDRIFELFQRLHGRGEYEGTGLGLAIVRKIVLRHGATIAAHSRPGEGSEFVIDWPLPDPPPDSQR